MEEGLILRSGSISWSEKDENRGVGSFGTVHDVRVDGFPCIAKRLHDVLRQADNSKDKGSTVLEKFVTECRTLSKLHHPNIVQFMGVHVKNKGSPHEDISLVMEGLYVDLDKFIEKHANLPLFLKLRFLLDTSNALVYLHGLTPPIVHRDVKAANVLLTRDMRAKLADLGTSKLLEFQPLTSIQYTQCPGTLGIMPPEALQTVPKYDIKLDVFSFGTLILHTVNQEFPMACEVSRARKKGELQITKRQEAITKLHKHCLHDLVIQCLQDEPLKRPLMVKIRDEMEKLNKQHSCPFTNSYDMYLETEALKRKLDATNAWASKIEQLAREKGELLIQVKQALLEKEMAESQALVFKEDFETERNDRARAAGEYDDKERRLRAENEDLSGQLKFEKANRIRLENELRQIRSPGGEHRHSRKTTGKRSVTMPLRRSSSVNVAVGAGRKQHCANGDDSDSLLQSLNFNVADHSRTGYRCNHRYEWYQTASDVVIEIMIQNVKENDIVVEFTEEKVKVFIETGASPYQLSLHMSHEIVPDKCFMKIMKSKVELKMKKAEGFPWHTLDKRGAEPTTNSATDTYFHKWDSITEDDDDL